MRRPTVLLLALVLAGCGIPADEEPRPVDSGGGPLPSHVPLVLGEGTAVERLCFVRDGRLARAARRVPQPVPAERQLRDLLDGPTAAEAAQGFTSTLTGTTTTIAYQLAGGRAVIDVGDRSPHGVRNDEILAFGQIVCTLASRPEVGTIVFTSQGVALRVPRADGSLTGDPLTVADYAPLID